VDFATHDGNAHPVTPPLAIHPALLKEKPVEKRHGFFKKAVKLAGKKALHTGKIAKAKNDKRVEQIKEVRSNTRFQINAILDQDDLTDNQKFHKIQELMQRNNKYLQKDDYKIYNARLAELHKRMTTPPTPHVQQEPEPIQQSNDDIRYEKAVNNAHTMFENAQNENKLDEDSKKLSVESTVSAERSS